MEEEGQPEGDTENVCAVSSSRVSALESERFSEFCVSVPACLPLCGCLECRWCTPVEVHPLSVYVGVLSGTIHPCLWLLRGLT